MGHRAVENVMGASLAMNPLSDLSSKIR